MWYSNSRQTISDGFTWQQHVGIKQFEPDRLCNVSDRQHRHKASQWHKSLRRYWKDNMSQSAFLSACHSPVSAPQVPNQSKRSCFYMAIDSSTHSLSLIFCLSHRLSFSILCSFGGFFLPLVSCCLLSIMFSFRSTTHTYDTHSHWECCAFPWPLTAHWHPPISQWETLTVKEEITKEGRLRGKSFFTRDIIIRSSQQVISRCHHDETSNNNQSETRGHTHTYSTHTGWQAHPYLCPRVLTNMQLYLVVTSAIAAQQCLRAAWMICWYRGWDSSRSICSSSDKQSFGWGRKASNSIDVTLLAVRCVFVFIASYKCATQGNYWSQTSFEQANSWADLI